MSQTKEQDFTIHLYRELMHTTRNLRKDVSSVLREKGLTGSQYAVLEAIPDEGIALSAVAKVIRREPSNITGIVDRLEQSGWIERGRDPDDRRVIRIYLTDEGRNLLSEIQAVYPLNIHRRLSVLSQEEKETLLQILAKLKKTNEMIADT